MGQSFDYNKIFDDPAVMLGYDAVPKIPVQVLPRGGVSLQTESVGNIQFGIPPETIKDSMLMGMEVPSVYIVPIERFCREMGPALGINVAEFEFPAYFNYFVKGKRCTLVVDSIDAETDIRSVFGETLLGPPEFRNADVPVANIEEDFDPAFDRNKRPNFYKEFYNFRTAEASTNYQELTIDTLLKFAHFQGSGRLQGSSSVFDSSRERLGVPPTVMDFSEFDDDDDDDEGYDERIIDNSSMAMNDCQSSSNSNSIGAQDTKMSTDNNISPNNDDDKLNAVASRQKRRKSRRRHSLLSSDEMEEQLGAITEDAGGEARSLESMGNSQSNRQIDRQSPTAIPTPPTLPPPPPPAMTITIESPTIGVRRGSMPGSTTEGRQTPKATLRRGSVVNNNSSSTIGGGSRGAHANSKRSSNAGAATAAIGNDDQRRGSVATMTSEGATSRISSISQTSYALEGGAMEGSSRTGIDAASDDDILGSQSWMYSQVKWLSEVATVYPKDATEEQKRSNSCERVEIFKMAGGTEYIIHDVDKNGIIIGKAQISGTVKVPDAISVEGFLSPECSTVARQGESDMLLNSSTHIQRLIQPPTFHPPSFGVTVLGNSHGFDMKGSTSGYVLWVNGRGIMIDPPPFSSSTLEREGIRPQMIMAIIITHCHADHDAGAFQKIMTGSRVAIITTPTIYNSFIRKYSALSGLRKSLLRHSHRHRPAIIGQPLQFQGAVFHFTYTLHTIPCISFKVEWRGRSIVFTGDHLNSPPKIDELEQRGVLSKARADDLRNLPLQPCDVLLHEAGAPPIHTPLSVLQELPDKVKARLYVVHTAAVSDDSGLRVAPTGTNGTIRLDSLSNPPKVNNDAALVAKSDMSSQPSQPLAAATKFGMDRMNDAVEKIPVESLQDGTYPNITVAGDFTGDLSQAMAKQFVTKDGKQAVPPLVFLRPTCTSDSWFILNLLSAVPFITTLTYAHTMEVLEIAQIEMYSAGEVVVEGSRRPEKLCVFWEGTCMERDQEHAAELSKPHHAKKHLAIWYAGDWTGPISLQPDANLAADGNKQNDIIAMSTEGVKVIVLMMKDLRQILKNGSKLYRKYLEGKEMETRTQEKPTPYSNVVKRDFLHTDANDGVLNVLRCNSVLGSLPAVQKRYLESLAEGPQYFEPYCSIWMVGHPVEYAYLIVKGTATFGLPKSPQQESRRRMNRRGSTGAIVGGANLNLLELHASGSTRALIPADQADADKVLQNVHPNSEYAKLVTALRQRRYEVEDELESMGDSIVPTGGSSVYFGKGNTDRTNQDRFANKVLARLYSRRAFTEELVFSRGMFMSDTTRMISGDLALIHHSTHVAAASVNGIGNPRDGTDAMPSSKATSDHHCHTSNLMAGATGCFVLKFPRSSLLPFLDSNPGVLIALLGRQVVV